MRARYNQRKRDRTARSVIMCEIDATNWFFLLLFFYFALIYGPRPLVRGEEKPRTDCGGRGRCLCVIGEEISYGKSRGGFPACFIACWTGIGKGVDINSPSMAALFDVGVICGNMAASRSHGMTSRKKFGTSARGTGFYPFVLRRSATEETVGKSNLGFAPSPPALCSVPV